MGWGSWLSGMIRCLLLFLVLVSSAQSGGPHESTSESSDASKSPSSFAFSLSFATPTAEKATSSNSVHAPRLKRSESLKTSKTIKTPKKLKHKLIRRHSDNSTEDIDDVAAARNPASLNKPASDPMRMNSSNNEIKSSPQSTPKLSAKSSPQSPNSGSPKKSPRFISISPLSSTPPSPEDKRRPSRSSPTFPPRLDMMIRRKSISDKQFAQEKRRSKKNSSESSETSLEQAVEEAVSERRRRVSDSSVVSNESDETKNELEKSIRKRSHSSSSDTVSPRPSPRKKQSKRLSKKFSFRRPSTSGSLDDHSDPDSKDSPNEHCDIEQFFEKWSDSKDFVYQFKMNKQASQSTLQILLATFPVDTLVEVLEAHELLLNEGESEDDFLLRVASYKENPPWKPDVTLPILIKWAFIGSVQSTMIETYWNILVGPGDMALALYLLVAEDERRLLAGEAPLDPIDFASPVHFKWFAHQVAGLDFPLARIFYLMYADYLPKKMRRAIGDSNGDIKAALFGCVKKVPHKRYHI